MDSLYVERMGGLAGYGGAASRLRSCGEIKMAALSKADAAVMNKLFQTIHRKPRTGAQDGFWYRVTRVTVVGNQLIEVPEEALPEAVRDCVQDEIR